MGSLVLDCMDHLHRVTLPWMTVRSYGWTTRTSLHIIALDEEIVIIRANRSYCKMCGKVSTEPCISAGKGDRQICQTCLEIALKNRDAMLRRSI